MSFGKKFMDVVKDTIPAIAEAIETARQKMIICRYWLLYIKAGKTQIANALKVVRPDLKRYEDIVKQLKTRICERQTQLEKKKVIPVIQVFRHQELAQKFAALTEDIEKLKSEKALLVQQVLQINDNIRQNSIITTVYGKCFCFLCDNIILVNANRGQNKSATEAAAMRSKRL